MLPSSCHDKNVTNSIPFSLSLRIVRTCISQQKREQRFIELRERLLDRGYAVNTDNSAIDRARKIPREKALKKVNKENKSKGPVFAVTFDPRLPSIGSIEARHWRTMTTKDRYLAEVFQRPPLIANKRQRNIRQHIIRAKVQQEQTHPRRVTKGMSKCGTNCTACPYIREGKRIKINGKEWKINQKLTCKSYNIVYAIVCRKDKCQEVYIGETKRLLKFRFDDHRGYVANQRLQQSTGHHFNQPGHCLADMNITAIEQVKRNNTLYRKEREEYFIRLFNTYHKGMNKKTLIKERQGVAFDMLTTSCDYIL